MVKLTKLQREILTTAVESEKAHGVKKPTRCVPKHRATIDEFSKNYARYSKQMFALLDAGIIAMGVNELSYAYVVDVNKTAEVLHG